ncbi:odorant receptor 49b-like [Fopius arisanus]|uniref:Odorant receptor 49b-like n=1 Tax=Fopius arisanus TaxID=64838 RepID=A0A9R1U9H7_9HYME|nr:PREDICTED: odorant receptor 49b-like [Fopius arisanus]
MYLLFELCNTTLLLGLCTYSIIANIAANEMEIVLNYVVYVVNVLIFVFINCHMGQCLNDQSMILFTTLSEFEWFNLPLAFRKFSIICMLQAQNPLQMTAGHFYQFSLYSFTQILKTSMAYASMLRTIV